MYDMNQLSNIWPNECKRFSAQLFPYEQNVMNKNNHYYDYTPLTVHYWDQAKQIIEMKREGNNEKKMK